MVIATSYRTRRWTVGGMAATCLLVAPLQKSPTAPCAGDNGGLTLPAGFCATIFADTVGVARHLLVAPNGDVLVALGDAAAAGTTRVPRMNRGRAGGAVLALRDTNRDGRADVEARESLGDGTGIALWNSHVYFTTPTTVQRVPWSSARLGVSGTAETVVRDMPGRPGHGSRSIAIDDDGNLYIGIGSATNVCTESRSEVAPEPCPELAVRAGIWRYRADKVEQRHPADGERFAAGVRNAVAITWSRELRGLYALSHGRDGLTQRFPRLYTAADGAEKPAEEFARVERGDDWGWPYCYYDQVAKKKVTAPEYGGDAKAIGRCARKTLPLVGFPGHWGPNGVAIYNGSSFPPAYRGGAFIAFHGSWNRAPLPQAGYKVVFAPFRDGRPTGEYSTFADGFAGGRFDPGGAAHRPVGVAIGLGGELYVSDDQAGRIWRITYTGRSP